MLVEVQYQCKFCGRSGTAKADVDPDMPVDTSKWAAMLSCNRCADYYANANRLKRIIAHVCYDWWVIAQRNGGDHQAEEERARAKLNRFTKNLIEITCGFFHQINNWEPHIVTKLLAAPDKSYTIMNEAIRAIEANSTTRYL